jgi:Uma2 family endonuclease
METRRGRRWKMSAAAEPTPKLLTAEEALDCMGEGRWELVRGEVREMPPAGWEHGRQASRLGVRLFVYVESQRLGEVILRETGYLIAQNPDTIRAPDAAFIAAPKVPDRAPKGWVTVVPDLVIEVISPHDRVG